MVLKMRNFRPETDFKMVCEWNRKVNEIEPLEVMFPTGTSFILEIDNVPALSACLYLTNCRWFAHVEHLIGNPALTGETRKAALKYGMEYFEAFARELGYLNLYCVTKPEKLKAYYQSLGFVPAVDGAMTLLKPLRSG